MVGVRRAREHEPVAGELLLSGADHGVDLVGARPRHHGVEVRAAVGERLGDERAPALRHGLVPGGDVGVDELGDGVGHGTERASGAALGR